MSKVMRAEVVLAARKERKMKSEECFSVVRGYLTVNEEKAANVEEPLEVPELFPIRPEYQNPECTKEGNEPPDLEEWLKRGRK